MEHETLTSEKGIWTSREGSRWGELLLLGRERRGTRDKYMGGIIGERNLIVEPTAMSVRCRVAKYYDVRQLESRRRSSREGEREYRMISRLLLAIIPSARLNVCGVKVLRQSSKIVLNRFSIM